MSFLEFVKSTTDDEGIHLNLQRMLEPLHITVQNVLDGYLIEEDVDSIFGTQYHYDCKYLCKRAIRMIQTQREKWLADPRVKDEPFVLQKVLNLYGKVRGKHVPHPTIPSLEEYVKVYEAVRGEGIGGMNFSDVHIGDDDLDDVMALAQKIMDAHPGESIGYINLEGTRIKMPNEKIMQLLKYCKLINVTRTPFITVDNKVFINSEWFRNHLDKIIFVPPMWIDGNGWKTMFTPPLSDDDVAIVKKTTMSMLKNM